MVIDAVAGRTEKHLCDYASAALPTLLSFIQYSTNLVARLDGRQNENGMAQVLGRKIGEEGLKIRTTAKIVLYPPRTAIDRPRKCPEADILKPILRIRRSCDGNERLFWAGFGNFVNQNGQQPTATALKGL